MNRTNVDGLIETRVIKLLHAPIRHNAVPHFSAVEFAQSSQGKFPSVFPNAIRHFARI